MAQYIHDNTEDEMTHEMFINAYLVSKGAETVNLDQFPHSAEQPGTGAKQIGRLTNLMQLTWTPAGGLGTAAATGIPTSIPGSRFTQAIPI